MSLNKIMGLYVNPRKDIWTQEELEHIRKAAPRIWNRMDSYYNTTINLKEMKLMNRSHEAIRKKLKIEVARLRAEWHKDNHYP